jgi:hypothetical protein
VILSQLVNAEDRHQAYRRSAKKEAKEEGRLWEDLRHGFILGSKGFVDAITAGYLPETVHQEVPQQKSMAKDVDVERALSQAAKLLGCDVEEFRRAGRVSPQRSLERDLLLYLIRQMGVLSDQKLGGMFGLGYSAVNRRAGLFKAKLQENRALQRKYGYIKSKIMTWPCIPYILSGFCVCGPEGKVFFLLTTPLMGDTYPPFFLRSRRTKSTSRSRSSASAAPKKKRLLVLSSRVETARLGTWGEF